MSGILPSDAAIIRPLPLTSASKSGGSPSSSQRVAERMSPSSMARPKRDASGSSACAAVMKKAALTAISARAATFKS